MIFPSVPATVFPGVKIMDPAVPAPIRSVVAMVIVPVFPLPSAFGPLLIVIPPVESATLVVPPDSI